MKTRIPIPLVSVKHFISAFMRTDDVDILKAEREFIKYPDFAPKEEPFVWFTVSFKDGYYCFRLGQLYSRFQVNHRL